MNAIGNDNYRPDLIPPEPLKRSRGWLSSNMAQLMVFLNGLILTVTAFATLSVFIDEIIKEGMVKVSDDVEQYISASYDEVERNLNAISTVIALSPDMPIDEIGVYVSDAIGKKDIINEVYLIQKQQDGFVDVDVLYGGSSFLEGMKSDKSVEDFARLHASDLKKGLQLVTNLPKPIHVENNNFAFIKKIKSQISGDYYLLAISEPMKLFHTEWIEKRKSILDLQIIKNESDMPLFAYQLDGDSKTKESYYTNLFTVMMAGETFGVKIDLVINAREGFLQKIPLLMLLFGVTLTLIGTLYVRNNQSQSRKLSEMNKELAHKNFELNQEIEERERLNDLIQISARENRAIINSVSDIIFELSEDGKLIFVNEAWNTVTGFENERSIGRNLFDLIYAPDQEEQRLNFEQLIAGKKKSYRVFTRLRSSDGSFRAVELAISMTRHDENKELRVVGTMTDVEERRRAERALSETEKKYRAIVENAAGGIYQVTPEGQFLSANPAMATILGHKTPEDVLRNVTDSHQDVYVNSQLREKFLNSVKASESVQEVETQIKRKDDSVIWVRENVRPVYDDEGTLLYYEGSMEDVDQRKKAEVALTQAKIESDLSNRAKSEFLANMSHELRTPLNSVIGFSEIIKNEAFGALPSQEYKDYADNIYNSGNRLLRVINEILDVSRIEAGERTLNESLVPVNDVVTSCLELMEGKIKSSGMRIENKVKHENFSFIVEKQAVKQMLLNLMSNAIKYSSDNGFMLLDSELDSKGRLRLSVTDTGMGMNDDELEKALSPFGQLDAEHNRSKSGTGLGLTLVKSLIDLHGGELELVSQKGIGTTATLIFPTKRIAVTKESSEEKNENIVSPSEHHQEHDAVMETKES